MHVYDLRNWHCFFCVSVLIVGALVVVLLSGTPQKGLEALKWPNCAVHCSWGERRVFLLFSLSCVSVLIVGALLMLVETALARDTRHRTRLEVLRFHAVESVWYATHAMLSQCEYSSTLAEGGQTWTFNI